MIGIFMKTLAGSRLLVVEDDDLIGMILSTILEGEGAVVLGPYRSCSEADSHVGADAIDGALLDVNLPDGTSYNLARVLEDRGIPYAFLSASDASEVPADLHPRRLLSKPMQGAKIIAECGALVGEK
ncbi:response regulator [Luteibacter yeojuensis]|uniref:response regulator n=1 Tax=Luteibacter yeojuensis TaxID=345309 RepID=UPI001E578532|nr:response regulator [Luteibacter yeojuensis]